MANFEINEEQAALIRELRKLETSDPVHADVYNALFGKLINNDAFLERLANKMIEKSMLCHVLDSVNTQQVLAADVGPKITKITDGLQKSISGLNTNLKLLASCFNFEKVAIIQPFFDDADQSFGFRSYYNMSMAAGYAIHFYYSGEKRITLRFLDTDGTWKDSWTGKLQ